MSDIQTLHPVCQMVYSQYPVRKGKAEKAAFRAALCAALAEHGLTAEVRQDGRLPKSHNIVIGDVQSAKLLLTAHYDTPARLPLPNLIVPRNLFVTLGYSFLLALLLSLPVLAIMLGGGALGLPRLARYLFMMAALVAVVFLLLAGPANPSNCNDNTSGVVAALEALLAMDAAGRAQVAVVLFDNEELGLVGSAAFRVRCPAANRKLLLNFDCVGEGDTMLFAARPACKKDKQLAQKLATAFAAPGAGTSKKRMLLDISPFTLYPSDQMGFAHGVGVAALRKLPLLGLGITRIHTKRDTVLQAENICFLAKGCKRLLPLL